MKLFRIIKNFLCVGEGFPLVSSEGGSNFVSL